MILEGVAGGLGGGYGSEFGSGVQGKLDVEIPKDLIEYEYNGFLNFLILLLLDIFCQRFTKIQKNKWNIMYENVWKLFEIL